MDLGFFCLGARVIFKNRSWGEWHKSIRATEKMRNVNLDHLFQAAKILTEKQGHPQLNSGQLFQLLCMVNKENSLCQHPTGSGKTYAGICLPDILLTLRDTFG